MWNSKSGFICAMKFADGMLFSGGKDGDVHEIDIANKSSKRKWSFNSLVRAVDYKDDKLLVGTRDGTIHLGSASGTDFQPIMSSHNDGEVWGLCQVNDGKIITSGDDNQVIVWDPTKRMNESSATVDEETRTVKRGASTLSNEPASKQSRCVTSSTWFTVVSHNDGHVTVRHKDDRNKVLHRLTDPKEWNEVMAFGPGEKLFAVGSHDNMIYVYETGNWTLKHTLKGHSSYIMALDWSKDGSYIRTNCGAYELLFWKVEEGAQDPSGKSNTTGVDWASSTVKFGWNVEGIYPKGTDGTHINGVCGSSDGRLLACGDDYGLVTIFRDPCRMGGKPRSFRGHSEHVVRTMFSPDDCYLWSVGGYDQTLMQWKRRG